MSSPNAKTAPALSPTKAGTLAPNQRLAIGRQWYFEKSLRSEVSKYYDCSRTIVLRTNVQRCLKQADISWKQLGDFLGIGKAVYRFKPKKNFDLNDTWFPDNDLLDRVAIELQVEPNDLYPKLHDQHVQVIKITYCTAGETFSDADIDDFVRLLDEAWKTPNGKKHDALPKAWIRKAIGKKQESEDDFLARVLPVAERFGSFLNSLLPT